MEKTYPKWQYAFAAVLWALTCAALYWCNWRLYSGLLLPKGINLFWYMLIGLPLFALADYTWERPAPPPRGSLLVRLYELVVVVIVVCGVYLVSSALRELTTWLLAALLVCAVLALLPPLRSWSASPLAVGVLFAFLLMALGAYLLTFRPTTRSQAERLVVNAGYQHLRPASPVRGSTVKGFDGFMSDGERVAWEQTGPDDVLGRYVFRASKGGARYCVTVSVLRGQIEEEQRQEAARE